LPKKKRLRKVVDRIQGPTSVPKAPEKLIPMSVKEYLDLSLFEPVEALINKSRTITILRTKKEEEKPAD
jgi:hypothetical protein